MKIASLAATAVVTFAAIAPAVADDHVDLNRPPLRVAAMAEPMPTDAALTPAPTPPARETTLLGLPKNVGTGDRILRTVVGLGLAGAGVYGLTSGDWSSTTSGVLLGVSAVPLATAATGYCPLYQVIGIERSF